jgi:hypothetical protein
MAACNALSLMRLANADNLIPSRDARETYQVSGHESVSYPGAGPVGASEVMLPCCPYRAVDSVSAFGCTYCGRIG